MGALTKRRAALMLALLALGCSDPVEPTVPLVDHTTTFEGADARLWLVRSARFEIPGAEAGRAEGGVVEWPDDPGNHCMRMEATNPTASVHQWLQTGVQLDPGSYRVRIRWATSPYTEASDIQPIFGALGRVPDFDEDEIPTWVTPVSVEGTPDASGQPPRHRFEEQVEVVVEEGLWLAVGYRSGLEIFQGICVDDIAFEVERS